jgi:hypothetical protein
MGPLSPASLPGRPCATSLNNAAFVLLHGFEKFSTGQEIKYMTQKVCECVGVRLEALVACDKRRHGTWLGVGVDARWRERMGVE